MPTWLYQGTLTRIQWRWGSCRSWLQFLTPYLPPLPPVGNTSATIYFGKGLLRGAIRWYPVVIQTCCIWGIWVRVGFPPPVSILCPACGSAQSESIGWSNYCHSPSSVHIFVHFPPPYPQHTLFQFINRPKFSSIIVTHNPPSEEKSIFCHHNLYPLIIPSPPIRIPYIRSIIVTPHHQCLFFFIHLTLPHSRPYSTSSEDLSSVQL